MMESRRNVPYVLARFTRAAVARIRTTAIANPAVPDAGGELTAALETLDEVANEIEKLTEKVTEEAPHA